MKCLGSAFDFQGGRQRLADLNVLEFVNTINEALCELHSKNCVDKSGLVNAEVVKECKVTFARAEEVRRAYLELGDMPQGSDESLCKDRDTQCGLWAESGDCDSNAGEMCFRQTCLGDQIDGILSCVDFRSQPSTLQQDNQKHTSVAALSRQAEFGGCL
jgi:hypothetical protein